LHGRKENERLNKTHKNLIRRSLRLVVRHDRLLLDSRVGVGMKKGRFKVPIYGTSVIVYLGNPFEIAAKYKIDIDPEEFGALRNSDGALFDHGGTGCYSLVVGKPEELGRVVSHEVYHLTEMIMNRAEVEEAGNREAHAYLHGYLMDKVLGLLSKGEKR
jgi:hypothetical protein